MKIYLDVLIITNIILTAIFIECTAKLTHTRLKKPRFIAASIIGGLSSLLVLLNAENGFEGAVLTIIKIITVILSVIIAFGHKTTDDILKYSFIYAASNILFIGICILLWRMGASRIIYIKTLTVYFDISLFSLMSASVFTYIIITIYEYLQRRSFSLSRKYHVLLSIENLEYYLPAVADSGNSLTDFFTGKPVVIIASDELYYYFELDREEMAIELGFHCIPYSTINGEGLINVTNNASVTIIDENKSTKNVDCAIGIISCSTDKERAIFSPELIL